MAQWPSWQIHDLQFELGLTFEKLSVIFVAYYQAHGFWYLSLSTTGFIEKPEESVKGVRKQKTYHSEVLRP